MNTNIAARPVAIVTGSTKGIGRGIAECLAERGNAVVVTSRDANRAQELALCLREQGHDVMGAAFDLEDVTSIKALLEQTLAQYGRLDTLVNNALSVSCVPDFQVLDAHAITTAITANVTHTLLLTKSAYPHLKLSQGTVINIGSIVVKRPILGMALYSVVKGAILQMSKSLAAEWAQDNIRVNCINPGFIYSQALDALGLPTAEIEKTYAHCQQFHPLGHRIGKPEDVGELVAFLASPQSNMITGAVIALDAGLTVQGISIQAAN